jgi:hypothetical protein
MRRDMEGLVSKQSVGKCERRGELLETLFLEKIEDNLRKR